MDDGSTDYIKGKVYLSESNGCITDEEDCNHAWKDNVADYFRPATEDEIPHEPKFKAGDWIINDHGFVMQVTGVNQDAETYDYLYDGKPYVDSWKQTEESCRLWTILDAKDGDVLVNGSNIFIFSHISATRAMGYCHINLDDRNFYDDIGRNECFGLIDAVFTPATKEQRETIFKAMAEAGYEWDAEKKELKKIDTKIEAMGTISASKESEGVVIIKGLSNLQYDVIMDLIMSWNNREYEHLDSK